MIESNLVVRVALSGTAAFALAGSLIFALGPVSQKLGLVDRPGGRKDHAVPTPVSGGIAVALGVALSLAMFGNFSPAVVGLSVGGAILILVGALDDLYDVPWFYRILAQAAAAAAIVWIGGVRVHDLGPVAGLGQANLGIFAIPFTILATIGLINAFNMCDGVDGLAGTLALSAIAMLSAAAIYSDNLELLAQLIVVGGAIGGFWLFNMRFPWRRRASVFLGNSGSALLGLIIAWASFRLTQNASHPVKPFLAPFFIAPPVIDCLVLMARRLKQRRSPFAADREHLHHLLLRAGMTPSMVVLSVCGASLAIGLAASLTVHAGVQGRWLIGAYLLLGVGYYALSSNAASVAQLWAAVTRAANAPAPAPAASPFIVVDAPSPLPAAIGLAASQMPFVVDKDADPISVGAMAGAHAAGTGARLELS